MISRELLSSVCSDAEALVKLLSVGYVEEGRALVSFDSVILCSLEELEGIAKQSRLASLHS